MPPTAHEKAGAALTSETPAKSQNLKLSSQEGLFQHGLESDASFFAEPVADDRAADLAKAFREVFSWTVGTSPQPQLAAMTKRLLTVGYLLQIKTGILAGVKNYSEIARLCDCTPASISIEAVRFQEAFGVNFQAAGRTPEQREHHRDARLAVLEKGGAYND